tara:strand:+ start:1277 stop:2128 length:852 start_codon:yes stop_codon:yes gene_type:complete
MAAATAVAAAGVLIAGTSAGMSFSQAAKQKKLAQTANKASDKLMEEAKRKAEVEFMQKLNVPLDAYDRQEERNIQSQQQNIEALQQGDPRNVLGGLGAVGAGATASAEENRIAKGKELFALQQMQVQEQSDINQDLKDMSVGGAADQQMRSRDAQEASAAAMQQGVASVGQAVGSAASVVPLFSANAADRRASKMADGLDQSLLETSVVNKNADAAKYTQYSTEGGADYDMNKAALYQDINKTPLGRNQVISRLQDGRFTDAQLKTYRKTGVYDQSFYDILNR